MALAWLLLWQVSGARENPGLVSHRTCYTGLEMSSLNTFSLKRNLPNDASADTLLQISHSPKLAVPPSVRELQVFHNGQPLVEGRDYRLETGSDSLALAFEPSATDSVCLLTWSSPLFPERSAMLYKWEELPVLDNRTRISPRSLPESGKTADTEENRYRLDYGGNKSLLITAGEGGGLGLEQSLQLDVRGRLSEKIFVEGKLSDQDVPIQPEGNTATLKEVDQVYVKIYGENYDYILGDYLLEFGERGVDGYTAQVQGMQAGYGRWGGDARVTFSRSRGIYHTHVFTGQYGKQKDYFLSGGNGETFITVLAGTEKIWRNGELLERGKHYHIEYGEGRIDFLNNVVVAGDDQFSAEFEYTNQDFPSTLTSGLLRDTTGALRWSVRGIGEWEDQENPQGFVLGEGDEDRFAVLGDSISGARTSGATLREDAENWQPGLYTRDSDGVYAYVDSSGFDSLVNAGEPMYSVVFTPQVGGGYASLTPNRYEASPGGGWVPGEAVSLPQSRGHAVLQVVFDSSTALGQHRSDLSLLGSQRDLNLYSARDDGDNLGAGLLYQGRHSVGAPLDKKGFGETTAGYRTVLKNERYRSFKQLIEDYGFREQWNAGSRFGERDFASHEFDLDERLWTLFAVGGSLGRARGSLLNQEGTELETYRREGRVLLGRDSRSLLLSTESKLGELREGSARWDQDNYKTKIEGGFEMFFLWPRLKLQQDEWITESAGSTRWSLKQEALGEVSTHQLWRYAQLGFSGKVLRWQSNFNGASGEGEDSYRDSLLSQTLSPKLNWYDLGPWSGAIFLSFQKVSQWESPTSDPRDNRFILAELTQRLSDYSRGYNLQSGYAVNRTLDVPLVKVYEEVPEGTGAYACDSVPVSGRIVLDCREDPDRGRYDLIGLRRDTASAGIRLQELDWNGQVDLDPEKLFQIQSGVLKDIQLSLQFVLSEQDSQSNPSLLPPFMESRLQESVGGRLFWLPALKWTAPDGNKSYTLSYERELFKDRTGPAALDRQSRVRSVFSQDVNKHWSYSLRQKFRIQQRINRQDSVTIDVREWNAGSSVDWFWRRGWLLRPSADAFLFETFPDSDNNGYLQAVSPGARLEKELGPRGKWFSQYDFNYTWGNPVSVNGYYLNGFSRGVSHRAQTGLDLQFGPHIFARADYLARFEPDEEDVFQRFTAEVRALF